MGRATGLRNTLRSGSLTGMTDTKPDPYDSINKEAIRMAADLAAMMLSTTGRCELLLSPGDATCYPILIQGPGRQVGSINLTRDGEIVVGGLTRKNYLVTLAMENNGLSYEWTGHAMHWDYCASKWTHDGRRWTGEVMARFLTELSRLVPAVK